MLNTLDFIDMVKEKYSLTSDYQFFKFTGFGQSTVSSYRSQKQYLSDTHALHIAQLLSLPAPFVLACVHAERAKNQAVKLEWNNAAAALCPAELSEQCILCKIPARRPLGQFDLFNQILSAENVYPFPGHSVQMPLLYAV